MPSDPASLLTLNEAHLLLKQFDCLKQEAIQFAQDRATIRDALLLVAHHSDYQILGICADTVEQGRLALESYAQALVYTPNLDFTSIEGAVYIKFNPKSGLCYVDSYNGNHRGVLVSCQSAHEARVNDMYGHLPLDLFMQPQ